MTSQQIREYRPTTLEDYVRVIEQLQEDSTGQLWYRGCSKLSHKLLPSLYRPREKPNAAPSDLSELEKQLVARFRDRSLPYHSRQLTDDLETLFFMQHYGVPTRLLDWTGNPFFGLFFALRSAKYSKDGNGNLNFRDQLAIWVMDPSLWNQGALERTSYEGGPLDPSNALLAPYKIIGEIQKLAPNPLAIFGAHNSQRIVVQQGTFVIFGANTVPMETLYRRGKFPVRSMARIIIVKSAIARLRDSLFSHGITEGAMFPDLEGLGRDLRRSFGFQL